MSDTPPLLLPLHNSYNSKRVEYTLLSFNAIFLISINKTEAKSVS